VAEPISMPLRPAGVIATRDSLPLVGSVWA